MKKTCVGILILSITLAVLYVGKTFVAFYDFKYHSTFKNIKLDKNVFEFLLKNEIKKDYLYITTPKLKENNKIGLHTLCLLDIKKDLEKYMTVNEAIEILLKIEDKRGENVFTNETFCIGCARLGGDFVIKAGKASELLQFDFGKPLHCLIVPGKMHFMEEDILNMFKVTNIS